MISELGIIPVILSCLVMVQIFTLMGCGILALFGKKTGKVAKACAKLLSFTQEKHEQNEADKLFIEKQKYRLIKCEYCGTYNKIADSNCKNCGATLKNVGNISFISFT